MKKCILSLIALCSIYAAQAQSCVSVQQISANYVTKQITFDLKWGTCNNTNHLYRVWVFVDYRPVTNMMKGAWTRAGIVGVDNGELHANNGVWVTGWANAMQRVTLTLDVIGNKFDWCAFATDYPPNATMVSNSGVYTLRGTPPFIVNGTQLGSTQNTYANGCITSITDATNNPEGIISATYTTNDGACASCKKAYVQQREYCGGTVLNSQYSTYDNESCIAGCAPPGSVDWTACAPFGFTTISNVSYEANMAMSWSQADTYCKAKGMRLPTLDELQCMCVHMTSLPGGYLDGGYYWSSTAIGSGRYNVVFFYSGNCYTGSGGGSTTYPLKCVK